MAVEIKVPDMGESVIEATIARWLKQEGERVAAGEPLVELETDKINLEVGAQQAGVLQKINRQPGDTVAVGDVLGLVGEGAGDSAPEEKAAPAAPASTEAPAPASPSGATPYQGSSADGGAVAQDPGRGSQAPSQPASAENTAPGTVNATVIAARMAQDKGIDLRQVRPTGSGGRITKEDVEAFLESGGGTQPQPGGQPASTAPAPATTVAAASTEASATPVTPAPTSAASPTAATAAAITQGKSPREVARPPAPAAATPAPESQSGRETRVRMSRRRQTIARRLVEAQHTAAMLTTFNEIDMSKVMEIRKRRREGFKERFGVDLGFMSFFVKAVVAALKAFPMVNAEIQGDEVIMKSYYDIGIAVGAEEGLVVPVIRAADQLNFAGVEKAIRQLADKARSGTLALDDLRGGTFTITNGGIYGSLLSTPILNPPQSAILGMHAIKERPVVVDGQIVARPMMYVALSYDHRIVDGREAVQFLVRVKEMIEDPEALMFG